MSVKRMVFVCTGNTCRSVIAQALAKRLLEQAGRADVSVDSAGVFAIAGMPASRQTDAVLQEAGLSCAAHRATPLSAEMVRDADLLLAMERFHIEEILRRVPEASGKTHLLGAYGASEEDERLVEIPDPIGKPLEVYEVCFRHIRDAVERVVKSLAVARE